MRTLHRLALTLLLSIPLLSLKAQDEKLLVVITADQLTTDQLEASLPLMGQGGIRKLISQGRYYQDMSYPFLVRDRAAATAALSTGATPSYNGIMEASYYDRASSKRRNLLDDASFMGNTTQDSSSAKNLLTSTLTDEIMASSQGISQIYAITPWRETSILLAGHSASGAFWIDESTGKWCSTTYYKEFPWFVSTLNQTNGIDSRIRNMEWTPLLPQSSYTSLPVQGTRTFSHSPATEQNRFKALSESALVNEEVNRLAKELLEKGTLGRSLSLDVLGIGYYAGGWKMEDADLRPMEIQDACLRLDKAIEELLGVIDRTVGLSKTIICLTSTSRTATPGRQEARDKYRLPGGAFSMDRCSTLLNMFLMATYGDGRYVEETEGLEIYLNKDLIEKKGLKVSEVEAKSAEFLMEFSGVDRAWTASELLTGAWSPGIDKMRDGIYRPLSGDLILTLLPGWDIQAADGSSRTTSLGQEACPMILFGKGISSARISEPVSALQVVPTLSRHLHVKTPQGASGSALDVTD